MAGPVRARVSRRSALAGSAAAAAALVLDGGLTACTSGSTAVPPAPSRARRPSVDETARRTSGATETSLAGLARAVANTFSAGPEAGQRAAASLVALSSAAEAAHSAHATAVLRDLPVVPAAPAASTATTASPPPAVPGTVRAAASALVRAQDAATAEHLAALPAVSGTLAALLASVAASDVAFASTLRPLAGGRR